MLNKLGIENKTPEDYALVDEFLDLLKIHKIDYTSAFFALSGDLDSADNPLNNMVLKSWIDKWQARISKNTKGLHTAKDLIKENNPVFIPRNHLVEEALDAAVAGNLSLLEEMLSILARPYDYQANYEQYLAPPAADFDQDYQTFCGT
jgi:uncharacterized protein YdiU (UPF0061 family)